jgi:hypothetical protein
VHVPVVDARNPVAEPSIVPTSDRRETPDGQWPVECRNRCRMHRVEDL